MFFSWYFKNKNFKQRSNLSGQIAPFLLVILVVLLTAAIATINIGKLGIDKTYSANAADAGALAGATIMSGMLNGFSTTNAAFLSMYVSFYASYLGTQDLADKAWEHAWLSMAAVSALQIIAVIMAYYWDVLGTASCSAASFVASWQYFVIMGFLIACSILVHYALQELIKLATDVSILKSTVENFYDACQSAYCDLREQMDSAVDTGEISAKKIAFNNSGISEKLSVSQGDTYSAFVSSDSPGGGVYTWQDKATTGRSSQTHTVTVGVSMPKITTYNIRHTVLGYAALIDILDQIIADLNDVSTTLYGMAISIDTATLSYLLIAIGALVVFLLYVCSQTVIGCIACCGPWVAACIIWRLACIIATGYLTVIGGLLSLLLLATGALGSATLYGLMDGMDQAFAGIDPNGSQASSSCDDAEDLMIVDFSSIDYPGDVSANSSQSHPGISPTLAATTSSVSSSATASYNTGDIISGGYDPLLRSVN